MLPRTAAQMLYLPYAFGGEVVTTTYELLSSLLRGKRGPDDA